MRWSLARWGERWGAREITDIAALPLAVLLFSIFFFVLTPVTNSWTRMQEYEADIFGLNAARQPDGEALVDLKLGDYRKLDPSSARRSDLLRSSQRTHSDHRRHAMESREHGRAAARYKARRAVSEARWLEEIQSNCRSMKD